MDKIVGNDLDGYLGEVQRKNQGRPRRVSQKLGRAADARVMRPVDVEEIRLRRAELTRGVPVPPPPFWDRRRSPALPVKAIVPYLNERMLYQFQWGYRKEGRSLAEYKAWARTELRPILARISDIAIRENILVPQAAYGYWRLRRAGQRRDPVRRQRPRGKEREIARFPVHRARTRRAASASPISSAMSTTRSAT